VLIILLVLLAPTIASLGFVRSIVQSQVNQNINGSVEIGSYSLGWIGGISASGVKVYDADKQLILQLNKFSTDLSLLGLVGGKLALGDTIVDVDLTHAELDKDGQLNYLKLIKTPAKTSSSEDHTPAPAKPAAPTPLPAISGKLTLNIKGDIYQAGQKLVEIQPSVATVGIPDINQPITNDISLKYSVGGGPAGSVHIAGSASAIQNNQLDLNNATADEKVDIASTDLSAAAPFLQKNLPGVNLAGIASGTLAIKAAGLASASAAGEIDVADFAVSGPPLKGTDRLAIHQISIPIDASRSMKDGQPQIVVKHADVLLNGGDLGKVTVVADAPQQALVSAATLVPAVLQQALAGSGQANQTLTVGGAGTASITASLDIAALAKQLPQTIALQQGTQLAQGHLTHQTTITLSNDSAAIATDTRIADLSGTSDGKPVQLSPVDIAAGLTAVGGATPDLHDVSVKFTSGFLNASGGGSSLSDQKITGSLNLADLQSQAQQFVNLDTLLGANTAAGQHVALTGTGTFALSTSGDLLKTNAQVGGQGKVGTSLAINGISISGIGAAPAVKLDSLSAELGGDLQRSGDQLNYNNFTVKLSAANLNVAGKDAASPILSNETITAQLGGNLSADSQTAAQTIALTTLSVTSSSGLFEVHGAQPGADAVHIQSKGGVANATGQIAVTADLKKLGDLAQRFAGSPQQPPAAQLESGSLDGTLALTRKEPFRTDVAFDGQISHLTVKTQQKPLNDETVKLALHGTVPDDHTAIELAASVDSRFASAQLTNVILQLATAGGKAPGTLDTLQKAEVTVSVPDLPAAYDLLNAFSPPTAATPASAAVAPANSFVRLVALDATDQPAPAGETPLEAARRRKRERAAAKAAREKAAAEAAASAPPPPLLPLQITSGSMSAKISIARDVPNQRSTLEVSDLAISKLALARGDAKYAFPRDVDFKLGLAVKTADAAAGRSSATSAQAAIQQIQVTHLSGDYAVGTLSMPEAIAISNPTDTHQIDAHGTVKLDGTLTDARPLLQVLQGSAKPMPYGGGYDVTEAIHSGAVKEGKLLNLVGGIGVTSFQIFDDGGKVLYTEPTVTIKNDLDYILAKSDDAAAAPAATSPASPPARSNDQAVVRSLTLEMPASQAVALNFQGRVVDPLNKRIIRGVGSAPAATLDLTYDLAKLWPIIYPTLTPQMQATYKTLKVSGKEHRVFSVDGYYPLAKTMAESIRHLNADGGLALDELDLPQGLSVSKLDLPFKMTAGVVETAPSASPQTVPNTTQPLVAQTAICNGGAVDCSAITLDLTHPSPLVTIAPNHKLLQSIRLNPVLAGTLGNGNLLFKDATQANGLMDVTVVQCDQVPLSAVLSDAKSANAQITYTVTDLSIDGPVPQALSSVLGLGGQGLHGGIADGKLALAGGEADNDFAFDIIRYVKAGSESAKGASIQNSSATAVDAAGNPLVPISLPMRFSGGILLESGSLKKFLVNVPQGLLPKKWASLFPSGLSVPFTGDSGHPTFDFAKAVTDNAGPALLKGNGAGGGDIGNLLGGLLNKHKKKSSDDSSGD
jgi:hypothetical protein